MIRDATVVVLLGCGAFFFLAGTVGLLRFPDVLTRIHALTKADNLGLGFTVAALALLAESWPVRLKLLLIWLLVLGATATTGHLIARAGLGDVERGRGEEQGVRSPGGSGP